MFAFFGNYAHGKQRNNKQINKSHIAGITFSGGDPLHPFNRSEVFRLAKKVKENYPDKSVWSYTGFCWEDVKDEPEIKYIDVLLDGRFVKELNDNNLHWVGSSNQRIINVPESLRTGQVVLYEKLDRTVEKAPF